LGIWPDGYYFGNLGGPNFEGAHPDKGDGVTNACAVERDKMLVGEAATMQCANIKTRDYDDSSSQFISNRWWL